MSDELTIELTEAGDRGRYEAQVEGSDATAELTYRRLSEELIVAEHTIVPKAFRGRGIAAALVRKLVDDARKKDLKILPQCSYVQSAFERHPEWQDLLAEQATD